MKDRPPGGNTEKPDQPTATPSLSIDWELYGRYLEESDLSDEEKLELINTLWSIVVSFVDLGFGLHPVQQVSGQNEDLARFIAEDAAKMIDLPHSPQAIKKKGTAQPSEQLLEEESQ